MRFESTAVRKEYESILDNRKDRKSKVNKTKDYILWNFLIKKIKYCKLKKD